MLLFATHEQPSAYNLLRASHVCREIVIDENDCMQDLKAKQQQLALQLAYKKKAKSSRDGAVTHMPSVTHSAQLKPPAMAGNFNGDKGIAAAVATGSATCSQVSCIVPFFCMPPQHAFCLNSCQGTVKSSSHFHDSFESCQSRGSCCMQH